VCQWSFDRAQHFHYLGGDAQAVFRKRSTELLSQHVSTVDDPARRWAGAVARIFSGASRFESGISAPGDSFAIIHVPVHTSGGGVAYAAGFAYRTGWPVPAASELELAALAVLQVVNAERAHTARFLHDVVAQCLSATGLQLELLRLDLEERNADLPERAKEVQRSLEEALERVRAFSAERNNYIE
jgi:signal transduction histidine kinase